MTVFPPGDLPSPSDQRGIPAPHDVDVGRESLVWHRVTMCGVAGILVGLAGLAAKQFGVLGATRIATVTLAGVVYVVGWAFASSGSMRPAVHREALPRSIPAFVAFAVASVAWTVALASEHLPCLGKHPWVAVTVAAAILGSGFVAHAASRRPIEPRAVVSAVLAAWLVVFASAGIFKRELYPLAPFQMYSVAQLDPREVVRHTLLATTPGGQEVPVRGGLGSATLQELVETDDDERVEATMRRVLDIEESRRGHEIASLRLVREVWRVIEYPGPPDVVLADSFQRMAIDG